MKKVSVFLLLLLTSFSVKSQQTISKVTLTVYGNKNLAIWIDKKGYNLNNSTSSGTKSIIVLNNLATGQHSFQVRRTEAATNRSSTINSIFNLRYGYDMLINVNENGSLELIESRKTPVDDNQGAMGEADFANLLAKARNQQSASKKRDVISNAFNASDNHFTTNQVMQLLRLVTAESFRLQLAKQSYRTVTDRSNFYQVYDLLNSQSGRNELANYVNSYGSDSDNTYRVPMTDANFSNLYQTIQQQWPVSTQMNSLTNAFNNTSNFFSTYQASQLIQLVSAENNRLQLAKLSYRSITDPGNFNQVYNLLSYQSSRDELAAYVNNYNGGGGNYRVPMSDANFRDLYQTIQQQWPVSTQMNSLSNAFNNMAYYFSSYQASQLIQLVSAENNRLQLAKLSYRSITDPGNFNQVYNLLSTQASRDELTAYVNKYNGTSSGGSTYRTPMTDADYNTLYQSIEQQWIPYQRMSTLTGVFSNTAYFFTCAQAKKLIQLVTLESNRLQLCKSSYRGITDRNNFSQLYDLLETQASRNELEAYVKGYTE